MFTFGDVVKVGNSSDSQVLIIVYSLWQACSFSEHLTQWQCDCDILIHFENEPEWHKNEVST